MYTSAHVLAPALAAKPLHQLSFATPRVSVSRSFGTQRGDEFSFWYTLAASRDGNLWAAWYYACDVELWTPDGRQVMHYRRRPPWFASERSTNGGPTQTPGSFLIGIEEDSLGHLWVFSHTAAATWKGAWPTARSPNAEIPAARIATELLYDTMVEVLDPRTARVIARRRLNSYVIRPLSGQRAVVYAVGADDKAVLSVVSLSLNGLSGTR